MNRRFRGYGRGTHSGGGHGRADGHDRDSGGDGSQTDASSPRAADTLVVFGITGDLAKVMMTFRSLHRLEPVWSRHYVESVQITMSESFGVEDRGHFYDPVGALRDVVVDHLMQVVAASAMEVPSRGRAGDDPWVTA